MAFATICTSLTTVSVIDLVAGNAGRRSTVECLVEMTGIAVGLCMRSDQREIGFIMSKGNLDPAVWQMARFTLSTQIATRHVIVFVAVNTGCRRLAEQGFLKVTAFAYCQAMGVQQREICCLMVKSFAVELHDVCVTSDMIGVATCASGALHLLVAAMKSNIFYYVFVDIFVAGTTQVRLTAFFELRMTR